jgi:hypothetical protein
MFQFKLKPTGSIASFAFAKAKVAIAKGCKAKVNKNGNDALAKVP